MKHLILATCLIGMSLPALATKRGDREKPVALDCGVLKFEKSKDGQTEKAIPIQGSDFIIELRGSGLQNYSGSEKLLMGKNESMEVAVSVTDHGFRNTIKIQVEEMADGKVVASAFADNTENTISREVDVVLSAEEVLNCFLIEKSKPTQDTAEKPSKPVNDEKNQKKQETDAKKKTSATKNKAKVEVKAVIIKEAKKENKKEETKQQMPKKP